MTKKMTRTALFAVAAVLVLAAICTAIALGTTSASAATIELNNAQDTGSVTVKYHVDGGWEVSISADELQLVPGSDSSTIRVTVKSAVLADNEKLSIDVTSANDYHLKHGEDQLAYTVKKNGTELLSSSNKTIIENIDGASDLSSAGTVELKVQITQESANAAKYVGDYTDTLNFQVNVG